MSPEDRTILVTGGGGGIGTALVAALTAAGGRVTVADRTPDRCPAGARHVVADLAEPTSVASLAASLRAAPPDILVNLAGINAFGAFDEMPVERLEALMHVNLLAPMRLTRAVLPGMIARGTGQVVNVGSVIGSIALPYFGAYAASKAGLARFSEALRRELAPRGIAVTHVAPRTVRTAMNDGPIARFNRLCGAREDTPDRVAGIIVDAIVNDRANVTIGAPEFLFTRLNALFPGLVDRAMARSRRRAEEVLSTTTPWTGTES